MPRAHVGKDPRWFEPVKSDGRIQRLPTVKKVKYTAVNDGKKYDAYQGKGYEGTKGFMAETSEDANEYAFSVLGPDKGEHDPKEDKKNNIYRRDVAEGHIAKVEYSVEKKVLRVTFRDNRGNSSSVCVYFRVPDSVGCQLIRYAEDNHPTNLATSRGVRHILGVKFWDLVRIRRQHYGAQFRFIYTRKQGHVYGLTGSYERHEIKIENSDMLRKLFPKGVPKWIKVGDTVSTILSKEQYDDYNKWLESVYKYEQLGSDNPSSLGVETLDGSSAGNNETAQERFDRTGMSDKERWEDYARKVKELEDAMRNGHPMLNAEELNKVKGFDSTLKTESKITRDKWHKDKERDIMAALADPDNAARIARENKNRHDSGMPDLTTKESLELLFGADAPFYLDQRYKTEDYRIKTGSAPRFTAADKLNALGKDYKALERKYSMTSSAQSSIRKSWTPKSIKDYLQRNVDPTEIISDFVPYIISGNYEGALTLMKKRKLCGSYDYLIEES